MIKKRFVATIITWFCCVLTFHVEAHIVDCPEPVILGDYKDVPNNYKVIYPLGWSKKGNFAYIPQDINVHGYQYSYKVIIKNTSTNEITWRLDKVYDFVDKTPEEQAYSFESYITEYDQNANGASIDYAFVKSIYWPEHKTEINDAIEKNSINISSEGIKYNSFATSTLVDERHSSELRSKYSLIEEAWEYPFLVGTHLEK